jgi:hypothetical protein
MVYLLNMVIFHENLMGSKIHLSKAIGFLHHPQFSRSFKTAIKLVFFAVLTVGIPSGNAQHSY